MMYWLYTFQNPEYSKPEEWAIYLVDKIISAEDYGYYDEAVVTDVIYEKSPMLDVGKRDRVYEDAVTDDPTRVIKFLFDQRFR